MWTVTGTCVHMCCCNIDCEDCDELHKGDCPVRGPILSLDSSHGHDEASLQHTSVPVPADLTVAPSTIPNAGLGVFAKNIIPRGVQFGPYMGRKVLKDHVDSSTDTSYMWEVRPLHGIRCTSGKIV